MIEPSARGWPSARGRRASRHAGSSPRRILVFYTFIPEYLLRWIAAGPAINRMTEAQILTRDYIGHAIERTRNHLLRGFLPSGRFPGGCEGRPLETAMGLHLLQSLNCAHGHQARLARYCREYLRTPPDGCHGDAGRLDRVVSVAAARGALGGSTSGSWLRELESALSGFSHPTRDRKAAVLRTLFAELAVVPPADGQLSRECARSPTHHGWLSVALAAVRILQAHQMRRTDLVGEDEVALLLDAQSSDGSWQQNVFVSILALLALSKGGQHRGAVKSGIIFILRQIRADGGLPFIANEDNWVTCLAGHVLLETGADRSSLAHVAGYLRDQQRPDGGWSFAPGVTYTDADDTSVSLMFLARQDPLGHREAIERSTDYLLDLQNPDGGFPTFVRGAVSEAEITAKAIQALALRGDTHREQIRRAWAWLAGTQAQDGSFREEWNLSKTFPIMHVLASVAACGAGVPEARRIQRRCLAYLLGLRRTDGFWPMQPDADQPHLVSTAYGVAGLASCAGPFPRRELEESALLLAAHQGEDGGFVSTADSLGPRPLVYNVRPLATIYSLSALSALRPVRSLERVA